MDVQKLTEKALASALKDNANFLITQPEGAAGSEVESVRRAGIELVISTLRKKMSMDDIDDVCEYVRDMLPVAQSGPSGFVSVTDAAPLNADDVLVSIEPVQSGRGNPSPSNVRPITGWDGVTVTRRGKNLLRNKCESGSQNGITWQVREDGSIEVSGTASAATSIYVNPNGASEAQVLGSGSLTLCISSKAPYNPSITGVNFTCDIFVDSEYVVTLQNATQYRNFSGEIITAQGSRIYVSKDTVVPEGTVFYPQIELGTEPSDYVPYAGDNYQTYSVEFPAEVGTVYGGTLDVTTGLLTVTEANIASYAGETLPGTWRSSMDVYAEGATPTNGAQVVYTLADPVTYQLDPVAVALLHGQNTLYADAGEIDVTYRREMEVPIEALLKEKSVSVEEQTLTEDQQAQARENIGAGSAADVEDLGEQVVDLKSQTPSVVDTEETEADLYICDSNGNVIAKFVDGNIITKNFDSGAIQLDLIMEADSDEADLYIVDSFGNVVAELKGGNIITKNFNSGDYAGVLTNISTLLSDVAALQEATSGILYRTHDQTDGVYAACRWHQPNSSSKQFCMLISGDIHTDPTRMLNIIKYLNAIDAFDAGVMLGDMSGNTFDSPITHYTDALVNAQKPFLTVLGNHDVVGATSDTDLWSKYGALFEYADLSSGEAVDGKCYYYKDFDSYKIRIIVLMQYDYTYTGDLCFGQSQIDWLIATLTSTPSDYGVIIAEHTNPSRHMTYDMDEKYTSSTWAQSNYAPTDMNGDPVPDIINAWINGGTLSQTYSYTFDNPPADLSVSADFSARGTGEFICYLGGHWHMDVLGAPTGYAGQPDYHVPAAGLSAAIQGDIPRKLGTISEDSFCVMGVDRDKKNVKIFHIGAHYTKDAVDRQYFKYSYGGANA